MTKLPELDLPLPDQEGSDVSSPFAKKNSPGAELLENNAPYGLNDGKSKSLTSSSMKGSKTIQSSTVPPIKGKDNLGPPKVGLSSDATVGGVKKFGLSETKSGTLGKVGVLGGPSKVGPIGELKSKGTASGLNSMGKVGIASKSVGKVGLVSKSLGKATLGPTKSMGKSMIGGVKKIIKAPNKFESKSLGEIGIGKAGESRIRKLDLKSGTFLSGMKKSNVVGKSGKTIDRSMPDKDVPGDMDVLKMKGAVITTKSSPKVEDTSASDSPSDNPFGLKSKDTLEVSQPKQLELKSVSSGSEPKPFGAGPGKATPNMGPPSLVGLKGGESKTGTILPGQKSE